MQLWVSLVANWGTGRPPFLLCLHTIPRVSGSALLFSDDTDELECFRMSEARQI